jgi:hypothetical protein
MSKRLLAQPENRGAADCTPTSQQIALAIANAPLEQPAKVPPIISRTPLSHATLKPKA